MWKLSKRQRYFADSLPVRPLPSSSAAALQNEPAKVRAWVLRLCWIRAP